jgi:hypothetical protein
MMTPALGGATNSERNGNATNQPTIVSEQGEYGCKGGARVALRHLRAFIAPNARLKSGKFSGL